jgi:hypothetical protein
MRESITGQMLVGFLKMLRQVDGRIFLLVEGPEDIDILQPHLDDQQVMLYPGNGKKNTLGAAAIIDAERLDLMYCVVDSDLDFDLGRDPYPLCTIASARYDLAFELIDLDPGMLERLGWGHASRSQLQAYLVPLKRSLVERAIEAVIPLAILRFANESDALGLTLRNFPMRELLDGLEAGTAVADVQRIAIARTKDNAPSAAKVGASWKAAEKAKASKSDWVCGHDVVHMVAETARTRGGATVSKKALESSFLSTVSCEVLRQTQIYKELNSRVRPRGFDPWTC